MGSRDGRRVTGYDWFRLRGGKRRRMTDNGGMRLGAEIVPLRVDRLDQSNFPLSQPALQLFLSGNGRVDIAE